MQPMLLSDYILGDSFSKKYQDTFVEQAPTFIHSLRDIEFIRDGAGNYQFKEKSELYVPFIQISYNNKSLGNFFIIFQKYMENPLNIIQVNKKPYHSDFKYEKKITCYLKPKDLFDEEGESIQDVFLNIDPLVGEVVIVYFYSKAKKVGYLRTTVTSLNLGLHIREHDRRILSVVQEYLNNGDAYELKKDEIKDKYKGKFTEQEYLEI